MKQSRATKVGLIAFAVVVACDLAYLVAVTLLGVNPETPSAVNTFFRIVTIWTPVFTFWLAAIVSTQRRTPVVLAASGVTAWAVGAVLYNLLLSDDGSVASPNLSDVPYLAFYPFMVAAIITLGAPGPRRALASVALEAVIASLGTASVLLVLVQPILDNATSTAEARPLTLAYPLLDVALVAVTAGYASNPDLAATRRVWWLIAGVSLFVAADLGYALLTAAGNYSVGAIIDSGWAVGLALMAWWAVGFTRAPSNPVALRSAPALGIVAPLISVVAAIGVLVYASQHQVNLIAVILATVTVALTAIPVFTRQALLSRLVAGQTRVLDDLQELDRAKTEMMATLNHEMRTPLTSVIGYLEIVRDGGGGDLPPEADEMLASAELSARRLHSIVDEMLVLSRLDAHGLDMVMNPLDVGAVVRRVAGQLEPIAGGRQIDLRVDVEEVPRILGDDSRLGHAITTIVENALKFTPRQGTVTVSVSPRKDEIVVAVTDTGMGVPSDDLPHLFDRFYRASNARDSAIGGSGLGLAIARGIVALHGGWIRAESVLGEGTTVTIGLPVAS